MMLAFQLLSLFVASATMVVAETTLSVFVFHRHGDRTAKAWPPTSLTTLGQDQIYRSGQYFREKYITDDKPVYEVSRDVVVQSQINVESPVDIVLQNSAQSFLQALYPPVGNDLGTQHLANGTKVKPPMDGYQLIPVNAVSSDSKSNSDPESVAWLQGISACDAAVASSSAYFQSTEYKALLASTKEFYERLQPVVGPYDEELSFKNAYSIYDVINVATINNASIPSANLLDKETLFQLRTLADQHQFSLAYNASEPIRAVAGSALAAQIVEHLDQAIESQSAQKLAIQFGAYATFMSFFGLAKLPEVSADFTGLVDYASSISFELTTEKDLADGYPAVEDINLRLLLSNGSAAYVGQEAYPLFGLGKTSLPYNTFKKEMEKFAIGDGKKWCSACGVTTGSCAAYARNEEVKTASQERSMSLPVAGVIGALVTLVVVLGLQCVILIVGGFKVVSKRMMAHRAAQMSEEKF